MSHNFIEEELRITERQTGYCPHCRAVANLNVSTTLRSIKGPAGKEEIVVLRAYHCEACLNFVRAHEEEYIDIK